MSHDIEEKQYFIKLKENGASQSWGEIAHHTKVRWNNASQSWGEIVHHKIEET